MRDYDPAVRARLERQRLEVGPRLLPENAPGPRQALPRHADAASIREPAEHDQVVVACDADRTQVAN